MDLLKTQQWFLKWILIWCCFQISITTFLLIGSIHTACAKNSEIKFRWKPCAENLIILQPSFVFLMISLIHLINRHKLKMNDWKKVRKEYKKWIAIELHKVKWKQIDWHSKFFIVFFSIVHQCARKLCVNLRFLHYWLF